MAVKVRRSDPSGGSAATPAYPVLRGEKLAAALRLTDASGLCSREIKKEFAVQFFLDLVRLVYHRDATVRSVDQAQRLWLAWERRCTSGEDFPPSELDKAELDLPSDRERYIGGLQLFVLLGYVSDMGRLFHIPNVSINDITAPQRERLELFGSGAVAFAEHARQYRAAADGEDTLLDLNNRIRDLVLQRQRFERDAAALEAEQRANEGTYAALEREKDELVEVVCALSQRELSLRDSIDTRKAEVLKHQSEICELESRSGVLSREIEAVSAGLVSSPRTVQQQWANEQQAVERLRAELRAQGAALRAQEARRTACAGAAAALAPLAAGAAALASADAAAARLRRDLAEAEKRTRILESRVAAQEARRDELGGEVERLRQEVAKRGARLRDDQARVDAARERRAREAARLGAEIAAAKKRLQDAREKLREEAGKSDAAAAETAAKVARSQRAAAEIDAETRAYADAVVRELRGCAAAAAHVIAGPVSLATLKQVFTVDMMRDWRREVRDTVLRKLCAAGAAQSPASAGSSSRSERSESGNDENRPPAAW